MDISAAEFNSRYQDPDSFVILDVREVLEFRTFNLGGENIPLGSLLNNPDDLDYSLDSEIVVVCQRGLRSETAKRILSQKGFKNVRNLTGGLLAIQKLNNTSLK